jgi:hypothetical protein
VELDTVLELLAAAWDHRYRRGRIQQVYLTHELPDGSVYRLSVTVQLVSNPAVVLEGTIVE